MVTDFISPLTSLFLQFTYLWSPYCHPTTPTHLTPLKRGSTKSLFKSMETMETSFAWSACGCRQRSLEPRRERYWSNISPLNRCDSASNKSAPSPIMISKICLSKEQNNMKLSVKTLNPNPFSCCCFPHQKTKQNKFGWWERVYMCWVTLINWFICMGTFLDDYFCMYLL